MTIISHDHKFIFIKTKKTAGTSIEVTLSKLIEKSATVTPISEKAENLQNSRNYKGFWNIIPELLDPSIPLRLTLSHFIRRRKFYAHMPAKIIRHRVSKKIWNEYTKFCVEREPVDKTVSHINMHIHRGICVSKDEYFANKNFSTNNHFYALDGTILVDYIVDYKSLDLGLSILFTKFGLAKYNGLISNEKTGIRKLEYNFTKDELKVIESAFSMEYQVLQVARKEKILLSNDY